MRRGVLLAAAIPGVPDHTFRLGNWFRLAVDDLFWVVGLPLMMGLILFIWAKFVRKQKRKRKKKRRHHREDHHAALGSADAVAVSNVGSEEDSEGSSEQSLHHHRRRRRRRHHRSRNPTRSETGGLPPERSDSF